VGGHHEGGTLMAEIVRLENVCKWVGEEESRISILNGIHLTLESGEYLAIMGASGSGKSTLLNLIGLLDTPSSGSVHLLGRDVTTLTDDDVAAIRSRSIGFIFQSFNLLPYLNALENVALPMGYAGRADAETGSLELLRKMKMEHRVSAYPATLSGGERQRVAIARALANQPALILADEPTGALDSKTGTQVMELIGQLHREGATVVLVTHDENVARRARRIVHMKDGRME
jgi:putative ABC transport system ATP-binding protein